MDLDWFSTMNVLLAWCTVIIGLCAQGSNGNAFRNTFIHPPDQLDAEIICSSYNQLCHLAYNITVENTDHIMHSERPICRCPGNTQCEINWFQNDHSITKVFKNAGQEIQVKMSYCLLHQPPKVCRRDEVAVILRGRGAFVFEIHEDFRCRCYRQLFAHRSWREGDVDYIEYSCGKARCGANRHPSTECTKITYDGSEENLRHEYLCRCLRNQDCIADELPTAANQVVMKHCQPNIDHNSIRRRRN